ncbi:MFS transporter [Amylibacter sp. IMCC11727]|uniref:MFS transporter n=1 Tax=Amylibacter sp. IMCC11727 TaxID=3039851 RepID=UPI00244DE772|nr:MFS transporter [Amylibacter sp. IMCC11727]WGI20953.1 MFS transporter [Amylibacter sp. IMCC11727]
MRLIISFAALFLSISLLQLSSGAIGPLDALAGIQRGFGQTQIGLLGSAHFLGFFIGCWWSPRLMGTVGHSRAFAVFAAFGAIGAIAHPMLIDPTAWAIMRIMTGLCIAGCYTVVEAWLQAKLTNETRGRVMGTYRIVDIGASSLAQLMIGVLDPASYVSYNLLAILCCACLFPLTLTQSRQPETPDAPRLHPIRTAITSPLGAAGVMVAGTTSAAFRMVSPIYGSEIGLTAAQIGSFLATVLIGGAVAQFPAGWLADKYDRRYVLIGLSVASIAVCLGLVAASNMGFGAVFVMAALFGATTFPIFSVSAAHANDFATPEQSVELNASLMFLYALGAIFSPIIAANLIGNFGPAALFAFISGAHLILVIFGLARMAVRPTSTDKTRYKYLPRTSYTVARLLRRKR